MSWELLTSPSGWVYSAVTMATNREQQVGHMTGFPPAVYPFAFNSMRSHSPFDLLANSSLFGRFGADLPKEMAALCKWFSWLHACFTFPFYYVYFQISTVACIYVPSPRTPSGTISQLGKYDHSHFCSLCLILWRWKHWVCLLYRNKLCLKKNPQRNQKETVHFHQYNDHSTPVVSL